MQRFEVRTDVSGAVGLGEHLETSATVVVADDFTPIERTVVCFGFPGGGYSRGYFTFDMPGATGGGEAGWHASRGWIFVACDHLSIGDSDRPADPTRLTFEVLAAANAATVANVLAALRDGTISTSIPPVADPIVLGIGQSMGGCLTIVLQGQRQTFDGIGILGYSSIHTVLPMPPGTPPIQMPALPRGTMPPLLDASAFASPTPSSGPPTAADLPITTWGFHYDDVPQDVVINDMVDYPNRRGPMPEWATSSTPLCAITMLSAGVVAHEASLITVPVLVAVGERDVCPDPWMEPKAYKGSTDISVFVCPTMSHMHNFASTRERFWTRLHSWGEGVAAQRAV